MHKGFAPGDYALIESIPEALSVTDNVCSSVNVGSTKTGINMDAVAKMGRIIKAAAEETKDRDCIGAAKLVVFCNAPEDNPFMAGAFHGTGEPDCVINVGVSGPGVVRAALSKAGDCNITEVADIVKRTAFKITRAGQLVAQEAAKGSVFLLVYSTFHSHQHLLSATLLHIFLRKWVLSSAVLTAQLLVLLSSMTLLRKVELWLHLMSVVFQVHLFLLLRTLV